MNTTHDAGNLLTRVLLTFLTLIAAAGVALFTVLWEAEPARAYYGSVSIDCNTNPVSEGETFRIHIVSNESGLDGTETFKVHWTTSDGSADESDYTPLDNEGQASNGHQTRTKRMGRTFHTTEDEYPEPLEGFWVSAVNAADSDDEESCSVDIRDDDGPGAIRTWIDSDPEDYIYYTHPTGGYLVTNINHPGDRYLKDETIRIKQEFDEPVQVTGDVNLGIHLGEGDSFVRRSAAYKDGSGTRTLTFEYVVAAGDFDPDGIAVPESDHGGTGSITASDDGEAINTLYHGVEQNSNHKVYSEAHIKDVSVISSPETGDSYRYGENVEVQLTFDQDVEVEGEINITLQMGPPDTSTVEAAYNRGSGTTELVFQYQVEPDDRDQDGFTVVAGNISSTGEKQGFGGAGSITYDEGERTSRPHFAALENISGHQVDGRPRVTGISVTSNPPHGEHYRIGDKIEFTASFDQDVNVFQQPAFPFMMGDDFNADTKTAKYDRGTGTSSLVFDYTVASYDQDDDGVAVSPGRRLLSVGTITAPGTGTEADPDLPEMPDQAGQAVYGFLPHVTETTISSSPAGGDTYSHGESIEVTLTFSSLVEVSDSPSIRLRMGDDDTRRDAAYSSGSGTDTLVFAYQVNSGDLDTDGVGVVARGQNGVDGTGEIREIGTRNLWQGNVSGLSNQEGHKADGRPKATSVEITSTAAAGGIYRVGETMEISVTFDQEVDVGGAPSVELTVGEGEGDDAGRDVAYTGGTGTSILTFGYGVQAEDQDNDGVSAQAKDSGGFGTAGTITAAGTDHPVSTALPALENQAAHSVNGEVDVTKVAVSSCPGEDLTYELGHTITVEVAFDDQVTVTGAPQIGLDIGGTTKAAGFLETRDSEGNSASPGRVMAFTYVVVAGDQDTDGIAVIEDSLALNGGTVNDDGGNAANLEHPEFITDDHLVSSAP